VSETEPTPSDEGDLWFDTSEDTIADNGLPTGGSTGQILAKSSSADFDTEWVDGGSLSVTPNLCLNPGMQVWQVNTTITTLLHRTPLAVGYLWGNLEAGGVFSGSRVTDTPDTSVPYSIRVQCTTSASTVALTDRHIRYAIYGHALNPYATQDLAIRFRVKSNKTGTYCIAAINEPRDQTYIVEYTINVADVWEEKVVTIPLGSKPGTWNLEHGFGIGIRFVLAAGTTYHATANTWVNANRLSTSNQVNLGDTVGNYFQLSKVQISPIATGTFILPPYDQVFRDSQRQYQVISQEFGGVNILGVAATTGQVNFDLFLGTPLYTPPTVSVVGLDTDVQVQLFSGAGVIEGTLESYARSINVAKWSYLKTSSFTAGSIYVMRIINPAGKIIVDGHLL
jgi:hypothetical protein